MNLDFHLYGTYAAALMAGFKENSARKIAMAAQMVDDFTEDVTGDIMISTATNVENLKNTIETIAKTKIKSKGIAEEVAKMSYAWVGFHFLPGKQLDRWPVGNGYRYEFLCGPNGEAYNELVNQISLSNKDARINSDVALGIAMHIIADTYSHCGFSGLLCKNPVLKDDVKVVDGGKECDSRSWGEWALNKASWVVPGEAYFGHGIAGHLPDISTAKIRYYYVDKDNKKTYCEKDNKEVFAKAFRELVAILNKHTTVEFSPNYFNNIEKMIRDELNRKLENDSDKEIRVKYSMKNDNAFENILNMYKRNLREEKSKAIQGSVEKGDSKGTDISKILVSGEDILSPQGLSKEYDKYSKEIKKKQNDYEEFLTESCKIRTIIFNAIRINDPSFKSDDPKASFGYADIIKFIQNEYK